MGKTSNPEKQAIQVRESTKETIEKIAELEDNYQYEVVDKAVTELLSSKLANLNEGVDAREDG